MNSFRPCPVCGSQMPADTEFCGFCGTYLGWTAPQQGGPPQNGPPRPGAQRGMPPPQNPPRQSPPRQSPPGQSPPRQNPPRQGPPPQGRPPQGPPRQGQPPPGPRPLPRPAAPPNWAGQARQQAAPAIPPQRPAAPEPEKPEEPEPKKRESSDEPEAVQPARPVTKRPEVQESEPEVIKDGITCPSCGTVNEADRQLCRKCGNPLHDDGEPAAKQRKRRWRPNISSRLLRRVLLLVLALALVIAAVALYPLGVRLVQDILDKTGTAEQVAAKTVHAGAQVPGHPPNAAVDGVSNRYWAAPPPGSWLEVTFASPIRLVDVIVHTGASNDPRQFEGQARPVVLDLIATSSDGTVHTVPARLVDRPGPQQISTGISDVVRLRVEEREIAGPTRKPHVVALGELEFFRRG